MRPRLLRSSTFRLTLTYMLLFSASVLILLGFIYWSTAAYMSQQTDATIEAEIEGLAERYQIQGLSGLTRVIDQRLSRKPTGSSIYLLTTHERTPLLGNLDRWPDTEPDSEGWLNFRLEGAGEDEVDIHLARARPFTLSGGFQLLVGRDIHDLARIKKTIVRALVWGLGITLILAGVGGLTMGRTMTRQIESINSTSREIMSGDLSRRIPTRGSDDDFDRLAGNLNLMLDRIQALMEDVRRVSDNIAHDLRTPLARLRSRLELLQNQSQDNNADSESKVIEQAVAEADGLLTTFNALLRIARIEAEQRREAFQEVALTALLQDVAELYEPLAEERGQRLALSLEPNIRLQGDRDLLFQALANLLDNAIKYTPRGGEINISLKNRKGGGLLTIADSGPGIPAAARDKAFQRFFRLEESRTTPGNGLGLSLVAAVANLHNITIALEDNQPGLRVKLDFACA